MGQFYKTNHGRTVTSNMSEDDKAEFLGMEDSEARGETAASDSERINENRKTTQSESAGEGDAPVGGADAGGGAGGTVAGDSGTGGASRGGGSAGGDGGGGASAGGGSGN